MSTLRETINDLKLENDKLLTKTQMQERKIMEIPRLEEQYMRSARSIVRQQEVANTMNKIEFRRSEEEVKNLNSFKTKAKYLDQQVEELKSEVDTLNNQNRLMVSRYQALQLEFNKFKATEEKRLRSSQPPQIPPQLQPQPQPGITGSSKGRPASAGATTSKKTRPTSAPAVSFGNTTRRFSQHDVLKISPENNSSDPLYSIPAATVDISTLFEKESASKKNIQKLLQRHGNKSPEDALNDEIMRLHGEIQLRDQKLTRLSRKLSLARSFPLLGAEDSNDEFRDDQQINGGNAKSSRGIAWESDENQGSKLNLLTSRGAHSSNVDYLVGNNIQQMNYMLDEAESVSTRFRLVEGKYQESRIEHAVRLQEEFNDRFSQHRSNLPPHIAAIRQAKSFVKVLQKENII
jgi:hypothetical protein